MSRITRAVDPTVRAGQGLDSAGHVVHARVLAGALVGSCHPLPTVAVTVLTTTVSAAAGQDLVGVVLVALAVLTGQLSIGWSNDLLDRDRDVAAGRTDKPLAAGTVSVPVVRAACLVVAVACVPLSLASGWRAGVAHLVGVAGGWAYNLGIKRTVWSWLPYAVSFGLLTAFVALGLPGHPTPAWWLPLAGALLGTGAHFLNVVPDIESDLAAGVRGLPQRIGAARSAVMGALLLAGASVVTALGPGRPGSVGWVGLGVALSAAGAAGAAGSAGAPGRRTPFALAIVTAGVAVVLLVAQASEIT